MQEEILRAYLASKTEKGKAPPTATEADRQAAALAAEHPEELLRHATVMRAALNRRKQ